MPTCPNGHQSGSDDWCEVCGHRMAGAVPPPPPPPPGGGYGFPPPQGTQPGGRPHLSAVPDPEPELCPQCRTPREGGAPFCEECRWNFLTNTATSYTPAAPRPPAPGPNVRYQQQPPGPSYGGGDSYEYQSSRPSQMNRPAEPIPPFGSEPSGPTPFGNDPRPGGPGGPAAFGNDPRPGGPSGPSGFGNDPRPGGPSGPSGFGEDPRPGGGPSGFGNDPRPGGPGGGPSPFGNDPRPGGPSGFGDDQRPGGGPSPFGNDPRPGGPSGFGNDPRPGGPGGPGGPSNFGPDPSRPVPPPPGPTPTTAPGGPGGGPQGFQAGPAAPPAFPQETRRPQQGGPSFGGGEDDWVISPPSSGPGAPGAPGRPGGAGGGYGYPQPGSTQAPPGPGYGRPQAGPATWTATIGPDREYFMAMMQRSGPEAAGLNLPAYSPEQQRTLSGNQITIGRRRHSTGDTPDIDLSVPPEDPGVSHQHAVLVQQPDGSWAVVDQNSTNGTTVNGSEEPIQPFVPVPLVDGDRVHVGAWTTITIRRS
ncbi:FHA domain-containing protein [Streptomyces sp. NPDC006476]|uniref:FHA domain-containing protein n=1 Tax=Streptomyces sp. NPDC006476 TaxID=3157175 RepID=UPI0033BD3722